MRRILLGLVELNSRGLIVPVIRDSGSDAEFTHQLITEATYKLMLEKQQEIHLAIAEEYEFAVLNLKARYWRITGYAVGCRSWLFFAGTFSEESN